MSRPLASAIAALLALAGATLPAARPARAGGFLVYDVSGAATGQGSAVIAAPTEPAAVWYNPAGLSFLPGWRVSLGG